MHGTDKKTEAEAGAARANGRRRAPGRPRLDEREHPDQTRQQLLDASIRLFARHGFEAVTTGQIAEAVGLTQSMVHYHFGTKSKLWEEAIRHLMRQRGRKFRAKARDLAGLDPLTKLKVLTRRLIEANADNPDYVRIMVHEGTTRSPRLAWVIETYIKPGFGIFDQAVREAMAAGLIRQGPVHDVTNAITSAASLSFGIKGIVEGLYGIDVQEPGHRDAFADTLVDILFNGLLMGAKAPDRAALPAVPRD